jgi:hypothetical protein
MSSLLPLLGRSFLFLVLSHFYAVVEEKKEKKSVKKTEQ